MELADQVLRMLEILCQQLFALFCRVFFALHAIVQGTIPLLALEDLLELVFLLADYFDRQRGFGHCTPVRYV